MLAFSMVFITNRVKYEPLFSLPDKKNNYFAFLLVRVRYFTVFYWELGKPHIHWVYLFIIYYLLLLFSYLLFINRRYIIYQLQTEVYYKTSQREVEMYITDRRQKRIQKANEGSTIRNLIGSNELIRKNANLNLVAIITINQNQIQFKVSITLKKLNQF